MADTIPDLWPTSELESAVLTPIAILRTQATLLGQKTQGLLRGDVRVTNEKGKLLLNFDVVAPAVNNYRFTLLSVRHPRGASYPATLYTQTFVTLEKVSASKGAYVPDSETAYTDQQFIALVQEVLQAPETIARLQSLIVRSNSEAMRKQSVLRLRRMKT